MSEQAYEKFRKLPSCSKEAENLDIILVCDGAASVGQVGHEVGVELTDAGENARMCCTAAVAAESPVHVNIARRARRLIVNNGYSNRCTGKILGKLNIPFEHEFTSSKMDV